MKGAGLVICKDKCEQFAYVRTSWSISHMQGQMRSSMNNSKLGKLFKPHNDSDSLVFEAYFFSLLNILCIHLYTRHWL
jgi:hypothetical protein